MDPNAALAELISCACRQTTTPEANTARAAEFAVIADELATWIARGGFSPSLQAALSLLTKDARNV